MAEGCAPTPAEARLILTIFELYRQQGALCRASDREHCPAVAPSDCPRQTKDACRVRSKAQEAPGWGRVRKDREALFRGL